MLARTALLAAARRLAACAIVMTQVFAWANTTTSISTSWSGQLCTDPWTCSPVGGNSSLSSSLGYVILQASATGGAGGASASVYVNSGSASWAARPSDPYPRLRIDSAQASASAMFTDTLTIGGAPGMGFADFLVRGSIIGPDGYESASLDISGKTWWVLPPSGRGSISATLRVPFAFGTPISLSGSAFGNAGDFDPNNPGNGSADAIARVSITSITVFDASLNQLSLYPYLSASGDPYPFINGVLVPEPAPAILLLVAVLLATAWSVHRDGRSWRSRLTAEVHRFSKEGRRDIRNCARRIESEPYHTNTYTS